MNWATRAVLTVLKGSTSNGRPTMSKLREDILPLTPAEGAMALKIGLSERVAESVRRSRCSFCDIAALEMFKACEWDLVAQAVMGNHENN